MVWDEIKTDWNVKDDEFVARTDKRSDTSGMEDMVIKKYSDYHKKTFDIIRDCKIEIPKPNETITILTTKSFSSIGVVDFIISQKGNPTETIFYIYSLNQQVAKRINEICENAILSKLVISDLQNTAHRTKEKAVLEELVSTKTDKIFVHSHAKIICLKYDDECFTILGSGNLSSNARVEQYQIINDCEMYKYFDDAFDEMKKIQVNKRNENLWQ